MVAFGPNKLSIIESCLLLLSVRRGLTVFCHQYVVQNLPFECCHYNGDQPIIMNTFLAPKVEDCGHGFTRKPC